MDAVPKRRTRRKSTTRVLHKAPPSETRRDEVRGLWTSEQVQQAIFRLVADLDANAAKGLKRSTRFSTDLGWDDWFKLSLIKPVKSRLHESIHEQVLLDRVKTVGDLIDYVWSKMEIVA